MATNSLFRVGDLEFINGGTSFCKLTATSDGVATLTSNAGDVEIIGVSTPTTSTSAANKAYVDNLATGIQWKESVRASTTASGDIDNDFDNLKQIDGVILATGDRILIKNQTPLSDNGIYIVVADGTPTRAPDLGPTDSAKSIAVFVEEGTNNADTGWVCTNNAGNDIPGTSSLEFVQFAGAGSGVSGGDGITVTAGVIAVDASVVRVTGDQLIAGVKAFTDQPSLRDGLLQTAGTTTISGGTVNFDDTIPLNIGTGADLVLVHDGTNSTVTSATGDFTIDNTSATGSTILQLGTDTSATDVQIQNNTGTSMLTVLGDSTITTISTITSTNATASTSTSTGALVLDGGLGLGGNIFAGGNSTAVSHINTSDERKKKDITHISSSIDMITKLAPVSYKWKKGNSNETKYGLIAQEVRKLLPDAVYEDGEGFLSLDYHCIWTIMLKSHQELIESHQELIESHIKLSERVSELENSPKTIKPSISSKVNNKRHKPSVRIRTK